MLFINKNKTTKALITILPLPLCSQNQTPNRQGHTALIAPTNRLSLSPSRQPPLEARRGNEAHPTAAQWMLLGRVLRVTPGP
jgi:hypothetical protein